MPWIGIKIMSYDTIIKTLENVPQELKIFADISRKNPIFRQQNKERILFLHKYVRGRGYKDIINLMGYDIELWLDDHIDFCIWWKVVMRQ